jgi:hypothetical protein
LETKRPYLENLETKSPYLDNLEKWNKYSYEWKGSKNGRMEQFKALEYGRAVLKG